MSSIEDQSSIVDTFHSPPSKFTQATYNHFWGYELYVLQLNELRQKYGELNPNCSKVMENWWYSPYSFVRKYWCRILRDPMLKRAEMGWQWSSAVYPWSKILKKTCIPPYWSLTYGLYSPEWVQNVLGPTYTKKWFSDILDTTDQSSILGLIGIHNFFYKLLKMLISDIPNTIDQLSTLGLMGTHHFWYKIA